MDDLISLLVVAAAGEAGALLDRTGPPEATALRTSLTFSIFRENTAAR